MMIRFATFIFITKKMYQDKKVIVVLPAYNAALTLKQTFMEIPHNVVDEIVLVDENSSDNTIAVAKELGIKHIMRHEKNKGYGGNQKSCYHDFIFDNEIIAQIFYNNFEIAEITCPTKYFEDASSINFN